LLTALILSTLNPAHAQEGEAALDIDYAEIQPLATESLLLDVVETRSGRLVAVGERGHVVLSDDNGRTWRQAAVVPTRATLTSVTALEGRVWAAGHDTVIITSGDGGETWSRLYHDPERQQAIMDIRFLDAQRGVALGAYGLYLTTDDGGQSWFDDSVDPENEFHLNDLLVLDSERWIIAGEAGYSYRSPDGGGTWEPLDLPYAGSMWGGQVTASGCAVFFGLRGHILESCDFGETWSEPEVATLSSLSGAAHADGRTVIAGNSGVVLVRDNAGAFEVSVHPSGVDFSSVIALGDGQFLLVGEDGVHHFPGPGRQAADQTASGTSP
jgi:photosystem II stability/assembly factor-like uncharacterized protein